MLGFTEGLPSSGEERLDFIEIGEERLGFTERGSS
jgi:hypothetical protein